MGADTHAAVPTLTSGVRDDIGDEGDVLPPTHFVLESNRPRVDSLLLTEGGNAEGDDFPEGSEELVG
jgi:hypothetical protein